MSFSFNINNKRKSVGYEEMQQSNVNRRRLYVPSEIEETYEQSSPMYYGYNPSNQEMYQEEEFSYVEPENTNTALVLYNPEQIQRQRLQSRLWNFIEYANLQDLQILANYLDQLTLEALPY